MNKKQALQEFEPIRVQLAGQGKVTLRCAWNDFVDYLQKSGNITEHQASTWANPFCKESR